MNHSSKTPSNVLKYKKMETQYLLTDSTSRVELLTLPFLQSEIGIIQDILRKKHSILAGPDEDSDPYELATLLQTNRISNVAIKALLDRNFFTRIINLAGGIVLDKKQSDYAIYKLSSALMAYLIIGDVLIEPSLALYEPSQLSGEEQLNKELLLFSIADSIHPQYYIDIALEKTTQIEEQEIQRSKSAYIAKYGTFKNISLPEPLFIWQQNYMCVLKIASLERSDLTNLEKINYLFDWMEKESFFNAIAIVFAILYLGPNRKRPLLKGAKTQNGDKLKENLFNATWDMTYIRYWTQNKTNGNSAETWLLCTHDYPLYRVANSVLTSDDTKTAEKNLKSIFIENWNGREGNLLFEKYNNANIATIINGPGRDILLKDRFAKVKDSIIEQERELEIHGHC